MEQLIELLEQIQELAGVGVDALRQATEGAEDMDEAPVEEEEYMDEAPPEEMEEEYVDEEDAVMTA